MKQHRSSSSFTFSLSLTQRFVFLCVQIHFSSSFLNVQYSLAYRELLHARDYTNVFSKHTLIYSSFQMLARSHLMFLAVPSLTLMFSSVDSFMLFVKLRCLNFGTSSISVSSMRTRLITDRNSDCVFSLHLLVCPILPLMLLSM